VVGAAAGAVVGGGAGGAAAFDVDGAAVAGAVVLCGFGFAFLAAAVGLADVAVAVGEPTADARAEALAIGEVLPVGETFPPQLEIPMTISTMKPTTARPNLFCFFIGGPSDGPPLSARQRPPEARKTTGNADDQKRMRRDFPIPFPIPILILTFRRIDMFTR
jgi:hypothetical protein